MSARWSTGWALVSPVEVRQVGNLIYIERSRLPVALVSHPVDQVGDVAAPPGEVVGHVGDVDALVSTAVDKPVELDPLGAAVAELIRTARVEGRPIGRRTLARQLGVTEYRAGQLLARAATTNGTGGRHERP